MSPQTSYKQKTTTILQHFSRLELWYRSFSQILNSKTSKFGFQTFKIRFSDIQNSFFSPSKFAFQTFKIRVPDLQNSNFKALKFALQGLTHEPKKSIEIRGRELKYCLK